MQLVSKTSNNYTQTIHLGRNTCTHYALYTIASADYTSKSVDLMFGPSSRRQCVLIPVINDMVPEVPECFSVVLSMTTPLAGVILTPDNATVVINDDDGKWSDRSHVWQNGFKILL